jgi:PPM family protein phosphatase
MREDESDDTAEFPPPASAKTWPENVSSRTEVDLGACSHRGNRRLVNEDHFLVARLERSMQMLLTNLPAEQVPDRHAEVGYGMLVADGMGWAGAGEVASREAISTLVDLVLRTPDWFMSLDEQGANLVLGRLDQRFGKIREALIERARLDPTLDGMATTMTLAVSHGADLVVAHVGNSRAYLFHRGRLCLLTRDQTLAQTLADSGVIRRDEAATHYSRHVLTGSIATRREEAHAELCQVWLADGDQLLLCTNGLTDMVTEAAIEHVLERSETAAVASRALVDLALERGGEDNATAVVARYHLLKQLNG